MFWKRKSTSSKALPSNVLLPSISGSKCVQASPIEASCQACVDSCPDQAIILDDEMLGLDESACSGCGICQAACVQNAITLSEAPTVIGQQVLLVCEKTKPSYGKLRVACVHQIGIEQLAKFCNLGVRKIIMAKGDCSDCKKPDLLLEEHLSQFNALAKSRDLPLIELVSAPEIPDSKWKKFVDEQVIDAGKRQLFMRVADRLRDDEDACFDQNKQLSLALFQAEKADNEEALFYMVPSIDQNKCEGCDACVKICPQETLMFVNDGAGPSYYKIRPQNCTGCGLCVDICPAGAIGLSAMGVCQNDTIPLRSFICNSCGAPSHVTDKSSNGGSLCRICLQTQHHKKLFQVLS